MIDKEIGMTNKGMVERQTENKERNTMLMIDRDNQREAETESHTESLRVTKRVRESQRKSERGVLKKNKIIKERESLQQSEKVIQRVGGIRTEREREREREREKHLEAKY